MAKRRNQKKEKALRNQAYARKFRKRTPIGRFGNKRFGGNRFGEGGEENEEGAESTDEGAESTGANKF
jgi:hypothetical protein